MWESQLPRGLLPGPAAHLPTEEGPLTSNTSKVWQLVAALINPKHSSREAGMFQGVWDSGERSSWVLPCHAVSAPPPEPPLLGSLHRDFSAQSGRGVHAFSKTWEPYLYVKMFHKLPSIPTVPITIKPIDGQEGPKATINSTELFGFTCLLTVSIYVKGKVAHPRG